MQKEIKKYNDIIMPAFDNLELDDPSGHFNTNPSMIMLLSFWWVSHTPEMLGFRDTVTETLQGKPWPPCF